MSSSFVIIQSNKIDNNKSLFNDDEKNTKSIKLHHSSQNSLLVPPTKNKSSKNGYHKHYDITQALSISISQVSDSLMSIPSNIYPSSHNITISMHNITNSITPIKLSDIPSNNSVNYNGLQIMDTYTSDIDTPSVSAVEASFSHMSKTKSLVMLNIFCFCIFKYIEYVYIFHINVLIY